MNLIEFIEADGNSRIINLDNVLEISHTTALGSNMTAIYRDGRTSELLNIPYKKVCEELQRLGLIKGTIRNE